MYLLLLCRLDSSLKFTKGLNSPRRLTTKTIPLGCCLTLFDLLVYRRGRGHIFIFNWSTISKLKTNRCINVATWETSKARFIKQKLACRVKARCCTDLSNGWLEATLSSVSCVTFWLSRKAANGYLRHSKRTTRKKLTFVLYLTKRVQCQIISEKKHLNTQKIYKSQTCVLARV